MNTGELVKKLPKALVNQPYEFLISGLLVLSSITVLIGVGSPRAISHIGGMSYSYIWAVSTLVGSALIVAGLTISSNAKSFIRMYYGHNTERIGLILQSTAAILYGIAAFFLNGRGGAVGATMLIGIGVTGIVRYLIISGTVQLLKKSSGVSKESKSNGHS
jgi:hypothetical protein